jgi:hypothetical protein
LAAKAFWTIPNLLLHDKPLPLSQQQAFGLFVYCSNPDCPFNAVIDPNGFPDEITYNDLQPRMLCTVCDRAKNAYFLVALAREQ